MKNKLLLLLILFANFYVAAQQVSNGKITYVIKIAAQRVEEYRNSERRKKQDAKTRAYFDNMYFNATQEEGILLFNKQKSLFSLTDQMKSDNKKSINIVKMEAGGDRIFYYNTITKENVAQDCKLMGKCFLIENPTNKWEITQETKIISGYVCYKAVITKVYKGRKSYTTAWFAPQIPVNFGLKEYSGLPGLTLELIKGWTIYTATKIELNLKKKPKIKKPKGKRITKKEFRSLYWRSMNVKF